ncbi:MAG: TIGR03086 family metal-binding protein [Acidothermaceae bacterium]
MATDPVDALARALEQMHALMSQVQPDQTSLPTPCASWDVGKLLDHILADMPHFIDSAHGGQPDYASPSPSVAPNWAPEFARRAAELVAAWRDARDPAKLDAGQAPREFQTMQIAEIAVHAWDLAAALGLAVDLDSDLAEYSADWMGPMLVPEYRGSEAEGKAFGPLVDVPADAPAYDRLVAISGRDPNWVRAT